MIDTETFQDASSFLFELGGGFGMCLAPVCGIAWAVGLAFVMIAVVMLAWQLRIRVFA